MGLKKKFISFCFAGASGAFVELISFNIFFLFFGFTSSKIFSLMIALSLNFMINRNITFFAKSGKITKQFMKYLVVYAIAVSFNLSISILTESFLGPGTLNANIATAIGIISAIPISFLGSLHWVFKDKISSS